MTPHGTFIKRDTLRLWTETIGNPQDPTVILIAGAGAPSRFWTMDFCTHIARSGYHVIRFDHRDTGLSSAIDYDRAPYTVYDLIDDVLSILDELKIKKAHIVGHSMGGLISQLIAINHKERALSFTSMSVGAGGRSTPPSQETMNALLENKPTQLFEESLPGFMRSWKILNGDYPLDQEMAKSYTQDLYNRSIHPVGVAWNHIRAQENTRDLTRDLQKNTLPGLFIHGQKDPLIPVENGIQAADSTANSTLEIISGMGHMLFDPSLQSKIVSLLIDHFTKAAGK